MVKIETGCRISIWRTFGRITWYAIPEPPATLQGAATWRIQCHDPKATCRIAGGCHRANSTACHPRVAYHIAGCCHLVNSVSLFQSHIPHCRVQSPGEINVMIPKLRVALQGAATGRIQRHVTPESRITLQGAATW